MSLVELTQQQILKYISTHNDLMREQDFADALGVSRVVVREALSRLRALGVIETKCKRGSRIIAPDVFGVVKTVIDAGALSSGTLKDLYEFRLMLEVGASDFIFRNRTPEYIARLEDIVKTELESSVRLMSPEGTEKDAGQILASDLEFHKILMEMTGNKSLMDFQAVLTNLFTIYTPEVRNDYLIKDIVSHNSLLKILKDGSPEEFRSAMHLHLLPLFKEEDKMLDLLKEHANNDIS